MKRLNFNIKDRKILTLGLCLILVCVFTLTIAYAALNAVLTIQGSAQVTSADWDIHLANPKVTNGSVTTTAPTLTSGKSLTFSTILNMPGDFYEFTVDVVNSGSIDAMIEKVTKTPELTADQAKYLNYTVSYANGESITNKQAIAAGVTMPIKVRVEYRKDLIASDLPTGQVQLTLGLVLDYVQSDGTASSVTDNGVYDPYKIGYEKCFGTECFYVISSTDSTVTMLAKYNLYVGSECTSSTTCTPYGEEATGMQNSTMLGFGGAALRKGTTAFSSKEQTGTYYGYYNGSIVEKYVNNYKTLLESNFEVEVIEARLITKDELTNPDAFACEEDHYCSNKYPWIYSTSYWTGTYYSDPLYVWFVRSDGYFYDSLYSVESAGGVRPVIVVSKDYFN